MKSIRKINALLLGLLLAACSLSAQDMIHRKNGVVLSAKVIEIGTAEVRYRPFDQPDGPIFVLEKEGILKIVFQDGHTEFYGRARMDDAQLFEGQKKSAIKISFLGPLIGYTDFVYERNMKPGRSWETRATIIGLGKQHDDKAAGFSGSFAYKFYKKPTYYTDDMKRSHLMQGAYIKPEFFFGFNSYDAAAYDLFSTRTQRKTSTFGGILLNLGKEWVFDDAFVLDLAGGIGYGSGVSVRSVYMNQEKDFGFAGTFTMNVGWMLK